MECQIKLFCRSHDKLGKTLFCNYPADKSTVKMRIPIRSMLHNGQIRHFLLLTVRRIEQTTAAIVGYTYKVFTLNN